MSYAACMYATVPVSLTITASADPVSYAVLSSCVSCMPLQLIHHGTTVHTFGLCTVGGAAYPCLCLCLLDSCTVADKPVLGVLCSTCHQGSRLAHCPLGDKLQRVLCAHLSVPPGVVCLFGALPDNPLLVALLCCCTSLPGLTVT